MTIEQQQERIERLRRRVQALKGKPGVNVHIGLLRAAVHQLMAAQLEQAREKHH